jgi:hypothetical protein
MIELNNDNVSHAINDLIGYLNDPHDHRLPREALPPECLHTLRVLFSRIGERRSLVIDVATLWRLQHELRHAPDGARSAFDYLEQQIDDLLHDCGETVFGDTDLSSALDELFSFLDGPDKEMLPWEALSLDCLAGLREFRRRLVNFKSVVADRGKVEYWREVALDATEDDVELLGRLETDIDTFLAECEGVTFDDADL